MSVPCNDCKRFCRWDAYRAAWWCDRCERTTTPPKAYRPPAPARTQPIGSALAEPMRRRCPDDGACHHACEETCWRVSACGPLSGVYPGDDWPAEVVAANPPDGTVRVEDVLIGAATRKPCKTCHGAGSTHGQAFPRELCDGFEHETNEDHA